MDPDVELHESVDQHDLLAESNAYPPQAVSRALNRLIRAYHYAHESGRKVWEFAVTIAELRRDGVSESDLRWLACHDYVEHAKETTRGSGDRTFDRQVNLRLSKRTAFVITSAGLAFTHSLDANRARWELGVEQRSVVVGSLSKHMSPTVTLTPPRGMHSECRPKWDRDRRELRLAGELVKVFKLPSPMQESILMAFEEEDWPPRIDDPLPFHPDMLPKRRLHDTIKSLNRNQKCALVRFMGDGTGEGVRWELAMSDESSRPLISLSG